MHGEDLTTVAEFTVREGERVPFVLTWHPSHEHAPRASARRRRAQRGARLVEWSWSQRLQLRGRVARRRRALADHAQGADLRADRRHRRRADDVPAREHRRRAQLGLPLLLAARRDVHALRAACIAGYIDEARAWRDWLLRAAAGRPDQLQIMYGVAGERASPSSSSTGCPATRTRSPCAIGNAAVEQFQLDVYGEVMDALHLARVDGPGPTTPTPGRCSAPSCELPRDDLAASPTKASGRFAAARSTSRTRR